MNLKDFYLQQYYKVQTAHQRTFVFSLIAIIVQFIWNIQIILHYVSNQGETKNELLNRIQSYKISLAADEKGYLCYLFLSLNVIIIFLYTLEMVLYFMPKPKKDKQVALRLNSSVLVSFLTGYYEYGLFIPSVLISLHCSEQVIALINLLLSIIIQINLCLNDFTFSLRDKRIDYLGRMNYWQLYMIKFLFTLFLLFNCEVSNFDGQELITFFFSLFYIGTSIYFRQYNDSKIRIADLSSNILLCLCSILIFLQRKEIINASQVVAFLIFLPISIHLSWILEKDFLDIKGIQIKDMNDDEGSPLAQIQFARRILSKITFSYSEYYQNNNSVILEEMVTQHIMFCPDYPYCFCNYKDDSKQDYIDNVIDGEKRKKFLQNFVRKSFQNGRSINSRMRKESNSNLDFMYCIYLLEICGSKVQCLYELNKMINEKRLSVREQMYALFLIQRIKSSFQIKSGKLDFYVALNYEKLMLQTFNKFEEALQSKFKLYDILNSDHIELNTLTEESSKLMQLRNEIKTCIINLSSINYNHPSYKLLSQGYLDCFAFLETKNSLKKQSQFIHNQYNQDKQSRMSIAVLGRHKENGEVLGKEENNLKNFFNWNKEELFQDKSCVVFMRITGTEIGYIIQAQKNFSNLFGYTEIIGHSINLIIPNCISLYHTKYINSYINSVDQASQAFSGKYIPLQISVNKQGWAVPVSLRMQIEFLPEYNELGLSCVIKKYASDNAFALVDVASFKIQAISEQFYQKNLSEIFSMKDLPLIRFSRIIPALLHFTNEEKSKNLQELNYIQTFAFLPDKGVTGENKLAFMKQFNMNNAGKELEEYTNQPNINLYQVKIKLTYVNEIYQKQCIVEIEQFKQITSKHEVKEALTQAQIQFQSIFQTKYSPNLFLKSCKHAQQEETNSSSGKERILNEDLNMSLQMVVEEDDEKIYETLHLAPQASHEFENTNLAQKSQFQHEISKQIELSPNFQFISNQQTASFSRNQFPDQFHLETDQHDHKNNFLHSPGLPYSISSPRQNMLSTTSLISPRIHQLITSQNSLNQSKVKILSQENIPSSQENNGGSKIQELSTVEHNQLSSPTKSKAKLQDKVEDTRNIWQFEQYNDFHTSLDNIDKQRKQDGGFGQAYSNNFSHKHKKDESIEQTKKERSGIDNKVVVASSIKSTQSHTSESKKNIYQKIIRAKKGILIILLNTVSLLSIIPLITMTLYQFQMMTSKFSQEKVDFQMIPWPMSLRAVLSASLNYVIFIKYIDQDIFPGIKQTWSDYREINLNRISTVMNEYDELYQTFLDQDQSLRPYFQNVTDFKLNFVQMKDVVSMKDKKFNQTMSFQAYIYNYFSLIKRLSTKVYDEYHEEGTVLENFVSFNVQITALQESIQQRARYVLNQIYDQIVLVLEVVLILSFIVIAATLPANYIVLNQVEEILKLFATLSPTYLQLVLSSIKNTLIELNSFRSQFTVHYDKRNAKSTGVSNFAYKIQNFTQKIVNSKKISHISTQAGQSPNLNSANFKRKNISNTSSFNKFSLKLIAYCVLAYSILVVQPITNKILIESFNKQALINIDLLKTLYDLKAHFHSNMVLSYHYLYSKMVPNHGLYNVNYYKVRIPVFFGLNAAKQNNLNSIIEQQIITDRYQMSYYTGFLFKILTGNMCEALRDHPELYDTDYFKFNFDTCSTIKNSILTKGFQISTKYFLEQFPILYEILNMKDQTKIQEAVIQWEKQFNIREFDEFADIMIKVITILKDFMINRNDDYLNYMIRIQTILLVFQCLALVLVFYFGWFNFYQNIITSINKSKSYLTLIDINQIIENPYIMSYLNKSS